MPFYRITKTWAFAASHRITQLGPDHKCFRLHGHNYAVTVRLSTEGHPRRGSVPVEHHSGAEMMEDYGFLADTIGEWIDETFDHRHLNDVMPALGATSTTAEALARVIWDHCQRYPFASLIDRVTVKESDSTSASYGIR